MRTDWQGSKAQNIGARAGGPPSRSFLTNCGVAALLWKICIPDLADWQDSSRSPKCSRRRCSLIGRSKSISQSSQSISLGGMGEGEEVRGGVLRVWGSWGGQPVWTGLDWPGGRLPQVQAQEHRHRQMCTCRPRTLSPPCATPPPCTLHLGALGNLSCSSHSHHTSQATPLGHPHITRIQAASTLPVAYLSQHQTHTPTHTPWISIITAARRTMFFLF